MQKKACYFTFSLNSNQVSLNYKNIKYIPQSDAKLYLPSLALDFLKASSSCRGICSLWNLLTLLVNFHDSILTIGNFSKLIVVPVLKQIHTIKTSLQLIMKKKVHCCNFLSSQSIEILCICGGFIFTEFSSTN